MVALKIVFLNAWSALLLASPFIMLGLLMAGFFHVILSRRLIERLIGSAGLLAVCVAALFGMPLPICSCGIVPVAIELRRKGASRPASLSFLITTPETSIDAVLLTWGMLGPIMMVGRLVATFFTALAAGVIAIIFPEEEEARAGHDHAGHDHAGPICPDCQGEESAVDETDVVGIRGFGRSLWAYLGEIWAKGPRRAGRKAAPPAGGEPAPAGDAAIEPAAVTPFPDILRRVARYGFVEMLDDLAFWFVFGLLLTGVISAFVPNDLASRGLGSGLLPMLVMFAAGVPLYMCASASIPIAAALVLKGVSPGAAMVFLLSGPATNPATMLLLTRNFGRGFVRIYLFSVAIGSLLSGLLLDYFLGATGLRVAASLSAKTYGLVGALQWVSMGILSVLLVWRLFKGAAREGVRDLLANYRELLGRRAVEPAVARVRRTRRVWASFAVAAALYLGSGFFIVPPDSAGYEFFCGRRLGAALPPGLHYWIPRPLGRRDVWRTLYPRKNDIGFNTDLTQLAQRREIMKNVNPEQWHSPVAAMSAQKTETSYLTGDENLVNASFTVHYGLSDPYAFFYRVGKDANVVSRYAQAAAREFIAKSTLDDLLTHDRSKLEQFIARDLQQHLDEIGAGVRIGTVHLVDIHPPQDAVFAFRDASSAREDRETRIHQAYETLARETPKARGQATLDVARAQAAADTAATIAAGKSEAFLAQAQAFAGHANLLGYLLWLEMAERVLPGREKFIVPGGTAGRDVIFWRDAPSLFSAAAPPPPTAAAPTSAIGSSQSQTLPTGAPKK